MNSTLAQLRYIVAVDTHRHYVTAAESCFVSQPTLSMQIKKLEEDIGVVLFDRSKQPVIPTRMGELIIAQARVILKENERLEAIIQEESGRLKGEFRLAIIPSIAPYLLPRIITPFLKRHPEINLQISELQSEEIILELHRDQIDAGILATPLNEPGLIEQPMYYEEMLLLANENHQLAQATTIQLQDLKYPGIMLMSEGHCFRNQVMNLCQYSAEQHLESRMDYTSGSLETLMNMIAAHGGFTLIPEMAKNDSLEHVVWKRLASPPSREVSLVVSRHQAKKAMVSALMEVVRSVVPEKMLEGGDGVVEWRG